MSRQEAVCVKWELDVVVSVCRHQAGWFPFNLENELQLPGDRANQDEMEGELQNHDIQEMVTTFFIQHFSFNHLPKLLLQIFLFYFSSGTAIVL